MTEKSKGTLDHGLCQEMSKYIEELTTTGKPYLDEGLMKSLKKICKNSDAYVSQAYHKLKTQLEKDHAEIRLSAFLVMNELFNRSHCFRELLLTDFQEFLELTAEIDNEQPLPPPKAAAYTLKRQSIKAIQRWQENFGATYKRLSLGFNYLKNAKKLEFNAIQASSATQRRINEERTKKLEFHRKNMLERLTKTISDEKQEIDNVIEQFNACYDLINPDPEFFVDWDEIYESALKRGPSKGPASKIKSSDKKDLVEEKITYQLIDTDSENEEDVSDNETENESKIRTQKTECKNIKKSKSSSLDAVPSTSVEVQCANESGSDSDTSEDDFEEVPDAASEMDDNESTLLREHGLGSWTFNIDISVRPQVTVNADNIDLVNSIRDLHQQSNKYLKKVHQWIKDLIRLSGPQDIVKSLIDSKKILQKDEGRYQLLRKQMQFPDELTVIDKSQEKGKKPANGPKKQGKDKTQWQPSLSRTNDDANDPTTWMSSIKALQTRLELEEKRLLNDEEGKAPDCQPSTSSGASPPKRPNPTLSPKKSPPKISKRKQELLKIAPVVNYGPDLALWGQDKIEAPTVVRFDSLHRFWTPAENDDFVQPGTIEAMTSRSMNFQFEKEISRKCKAPLPNGKLCQRMDRIKCPFHGIIINRDEQGRPTDEKDIVALEQTSSAAAAKDDSQDPEFLEDINAATGANLKSKDKKGKKKKEKKYPGLTDIKKIQNTTRKRLENKVLKRSSLIRVAESLNRADQKKYLDKFGNQFNYSIPPRPAR